MSTKGTFLVTHADGATAVLRNVETAQVHTIASNSGVAAGEVLVATLDSGPSGVTWRIADVDERWSITVEEHDERPTDAAFDALAGEDVGTAVELDTDAVLAVDAIAVPVAETAVAATELTTDEATLTRAARLGARRVTVRGADGVVSVTYEA